MVSQETLAGNWNTIVGAIKEKFGQITGDDLSKYKGNVDQLVGVIQRKTGETKESIEQFISGCCESTEGVYNRVSAKTAELADRAGEMVQEGYEQVSNRASQGYEYARGTVRRRPVESVAIVAGLSLLAGLAIGISMAARRR